MDRYLHGTSGYMAQRLGITDYQTLSDDGYGVIGNLPHPLTVEEMLAATKRAFRTTAIRYTLPDKKTISRVACGSGACADFIEDAIGLGADAFISADYKHHQFLQAEGRIMLLDIGHFESEQWIKQIYSDLLKDSPVRLLCADADKSPVMAYC